MLTALRRYLETWPVRIFFGIMVVAFVVWGVGDVVRQVGTRTYVAKVGGQTIEPAQFQETFQRNMGVMERRLQQGQDVTPAMRQQVAQQTLDQMEGQLALQQEIARLRLMVPDDALRAAVFAMPAFRGPDGKFDQTKFEALLRTNNMSEAEFIDLMRQQIAAQQILGALVAGVAAPPLLTDAVFAFQEEQRSALMAEFPFAAVPAPPQPTDADLTRWYQNHPTSYQVPEFRRIKAAILTADSLAKTLTATDDELHAYYEAHKNQYVVPPRRSLLVAVLQDEAKAKALAQSWSGGADWTAIQKQAEADGGNAVSLDNTTEAGVPDSTLAAAVFAAAPDSIGGPLKTALGWDVFKVIATKPGTNQGFADVHNEILEQVLQQKAGSQIYDVVNKVDDTLSTGAGLDKLPSGLGLTGIQGTLDAQGNTANGDPAPIPGPPLLRQALIDAAFKASPDQPPAQLTEVPLPSPGGSAFYALTVESVVPPHVKPFDEVKGQVAADWTAAARQKEAEEQATKVLTAVQGGESLPDAATTAGVTVRQTPLISRGGSVEAVPAQVQQALFSLKPKEPTMVSTAEEFVVLVPDKIETPKPDQDKAAYEAISGALKQSITTDVSAIIARALRERAAPQVNQPVFDSFATGS